MFKLGCIPDIPDARDINATKLFTVLSTSVDKLYIDGAIKTIQSPFVTRSSSSGVDLRSYCPQVENQLSLSSCVANATVGALETLRSIAGVSHVDFSRLFLYYNARLRHSAQGVDNGTQIRHCMASLTLDGVTTESNWAYNTSLVNTRPSWSAYRSAYFNKLSGYYRISSLDLVSDIKTSLNSKHSVVISVEVDGSFQTIDSSGVYNSRGGNILGRHAMLIVGYDDIQRRLIVRNSWGETWGDKGYCYIPYQLFINEMKPLDIWVPTITVTSVLK